MEQPTPAAAGQPAPDSAPPVLLTISQTTLAFALAEWEAAHRSGRTRTYSETANLPVEQVVAESTAFLWSLLSAAATPAAGGTAGDPVVSTIIPAAIHPSRLPANHRPCTECRYRVRVAGSVHAYCDHYAMPVDPVTGNPTRTCEKERHPDSPKRGCGQRGRLFEPKTQAA